MPQTPLVQVRVAHSVSAPGQSIGLLQPVPPVPPCPPVPVAVLVLVLVLVLGLVAPP
jgi:hypothetical protein